MNANDTKELSEFLAKSLNTNLAKAIQTFELTQAVFEDAHKAFVKVNNTIVRKNNLRSYYDFY